MIAKLLRILCLLLLLSTSAVGQLRIDFAHFADLFNRGLYNQVINEVSSLREDEYGKNWVFDYLIAKALCSKGDFGTSKLAFEYALANYPLTGDQKLFLKMELQVCTNASNGSELEKIWANLISTGGGDEAFPTAVSMGKMGYVLKCDQDPEAYQFDPSFDQNTFQQRLFDRSEQIQAKEYYDNLLGNDFINKVSGRFIFITPKNSEIKSNQLRKATENLERVYQFYSRYYDLRPPDKLIAIYLMGNKEKLREVALRVHGLKIPKSNIGYSCLADLSVLGNSDKEHMGTMFHELFHIMVRTDLGDIPGWLDEGLASLYEESSRSAYWVGDTLKGTTKPWRTIVLRLNNKVRNPLPTLSTIMINNWSEFTPTTSTNVCDIANNYAMVRHFSIYMQEKGWLQQVVQAFKLRKNIFTDSLSTDESSIKIFEKAVGLSIDHVQHDFDLWMDENYNISMRHQANDILSRLNDVYREMEHNHECRVDPRFNDLEAHWIELEKELNQQGNKLLDNELLDRSQKVIEEMQDLLIQCANSH